MYSSIKKTQIHSRHPHQKFEDRYKSIYLLYVNFFFMFRLLSLYFGGHLGEKLVVGSLKKIWLSKAKNVFNQIFKIPVCMGSGGSPPNFIFFNHGPGGGGGLSWLPQKNMFSPNFFCLHGGGKVFILLMLVLRYIVYKLLSLVSK